MELQLGARILPDGQTRFLVWAPDRKRVELALQVDGAVRTVPLRETLEGYFEIETAIPVGSLYKYRLDGGDAFPDPCSRFQPSGPHGPSQVLDPTTFSWTDRDWAGLSPKRQVVYELHVGTFTPEGTYRAASARLPYLKDLGITAVEVMPVNTFPGRFNWGYDGVSLYAPCAVYGIADQLRELVNKAHQLGLGVILDVVYNHLGPDGNYLRQFAQQYFSDRYRGEWGEPLNFEGELSEPVRRFVIENACHWIKEYHFDGLRLDATHSLFDQSEVHIVADIVKATRACAPAKQLLLVAESEPQDVRLICPPEEKGCGADAIWVDDFHHTARVGTTSQSEAYLGEYRGDALELLACVRHNSIYQGQWFGWQKKSRGSPLLHHSPEQVVFFLQNHDQISNHLFGARLETLIGETRARALTTLLLLAPQTPLLFMGQEFFASTPFLFFADHKDDLSDKVRVGRQQFLSQFSSSRHAFEEESFQLPWGEEAFRQCQIRWEELEAKKHIFTMHRELLRLRREDPVFAQMTRSSFDGAVLSERSLVLRYFGSPSDGDRLLILNLGPGFHYAPSSQPLLAPPLRQEWQLLFSSQSTDYGGSGVNPSTGRGYWIVQGETATVLASRPAR